MGSGCRCADKIAITGKKPIAIMRESLIELSSRAVSASFFSRTILTRRKLTKKTFLVSR